MNCFNLLSCENTLMYFTYRKNFIEWVSPPPTSTTEGGEAPPRSTRPLRAKGPGSSAAAEGWARANGSRAPVEARVGWATPVTGGSS